MTACGCCAASDVAAAAVPVDTPAADATADMAAGDAAAAVRPEERADMAAGEAAAEAAAEPRAEVIEEPKEVVEGMDRASTFAWKLPNQFFGGEDGWFFGIKTDKKRWFA